MSELHPEKSCCTTVGRGFDSPHLHHSCALLHEVSRPGAGSRNGVEFAPARPVHTGSAGALPCRHDIGSGFDGVDSAAGRSGGRAAALVGALVGCVS